MYEWVSTSDIDRLREHKEALRMERKACDACHRERMSLLGKITKIKRLLERFDAGAD